MLFILITSTNLDLILALNDGVAPYMTQEMNYLVIEGGEPNRIITHDEMLEIGGNHLKTTVRKFHFV